MEDLWDIVACAVRGADRAAVEAGSSRGDKGVSTDTLAAMNVAAAVAAAAASDRHRGERGAVYEGDEDSDGTRSDWDMDEGNSSRKSCLAQGHVLMRQAVMAEQGTTLSDWEDLEPEGDQRRFLWSSADTVGPEDCNLGNGEELVLVRPKRRFFRYAAVSATIDHRRAIDTYYAHSLDLGKSFAVFFCLPVPTYFGDPLIPPTAEKLLARIQTAAMF